MYVHVFYILNRKKKKKKTDVIQTNRVSSNNVSYCKFMTITLGTIQKKRKKNLISSTKHIIHIHTINHLEHRIELRQYSIAIV